MTKLEEYFTNKYLKNTCFSTLEELQNDETSIHTNSIRALVAVDLYGIWKGLSDDYGRTAINVKDRS